MKLLKFNTLLNWKIRLRGKEVIHYLRTSDASYFLIFSILVGLKIKSTSHRGFPVPDAKGKLVGVKHHQCL